MVMSEADDLMSIMPPAVASQWQFGDWAGLRSYSSRWLQEQGEKGIIAAVLAVAFYQGGEYEKAQEQIRNALMWGTPRLTVARFLAAGALNSLGRSQLLIKDAEKAHDFFQKSLRINWLAEQMSLLTPARATHQSFDLNISPIPVESYWSRPEPIPAADEAVRLTSREGGLLHDLRKIFSSFVERLVEEGSKLTVDGVKVFHENDPFLSGKIANGLAYWVVEAPIESAVSLARCRAFRQLMKECNELPVQSWGIYFYLKGLHLLSENGLLSQCFSCSELTELKDKLDWRTFVNEDDYRLIKKPNNFYSIAFGIAFIRYKLGWDDIVHSERLIEKELDHYEQVSGGGGFADETEGKGRYDRYSFLLIAEISSRFNEAGLPLTESMRLWLRSSAEYVLFNANLRGDGFQYGRSIGAYGDSAFLEILTCAARNGVLKPNELLPAYGFCQKITQKFLHFWWVDNRQSINIWSEGRATDGYRGLHRILGENLSLLHQHIYCHETWSEIVAPSNELNVESELRSWIEGLGNERLTAFGGNSCEYALFTFRSLSRIINLPLINGDLHYRQMSYQPIPFLTGIIQPVPDLETPVLVPLVSIDGGEKYIAYPCFNDIKVSRQLSTTLLNWKGSGATRLNDKYPSREKLFDTEVSMEFERDSVLRNETIVFEDVDRISAIEILVPVPNLLKEWDGESFSFKDQYGACCEFKVKAAGGSLECWGYDIKATDSVEGEYEGFYKFGIDKPQSERLRLTWCIEYPELGGWMESV